MEPFEKDVGRLLKITDPLLQAQTAASMIEQKRTEISRLATIRAQALLKLRQGRSAVEIAEMLDITRQQVHRLLREAEGASPKKRAM